MGDDLRLLDLRYGRQEPAFALGGLLVKLNRSRQRRQVIDDQIDALVEERRRLLDEEARLEDVRRLAESDHAQTVRFRQAEGWSPEPVLGYRLWNIDPAGRIVGATGRVWRSTTMAASCDRQRQPLDDLPHTDHMCSDYGYGCGVYAAKSATMLEVPNAHWILGLVMLSGKVVEHERGYRAAHAQVAAAIARNHEKLLTAGAIDEVEVLFSDPHAALAAHGVPMPENPGKADLNEKATEMEWRLKAWT